MPERLPLEPGAELVHLGAARARARTCCSTSPTSATAPTTCCCSPTTTRRRRTTRPARSRSQARRPIRGVRRHHLRVQRRQVALQGAAGEVRVARAPRRDAAQLADAVGDEGQRRRSRSRTRTATSRRRRTSTTSTPTSALSDYHQPYNSTTSFVWALPFGRGQRWGSNASPAARRAHRRLAAGRHQHRLRRRAGDVHLHAGARRSWSRASRRISAARTTTGRTSPAIRTRRRRSRRSPTGSIATASPSPTDPSQPFGNAAAQQRARPDVLAARSRRVASASPLGGSAAVRVPARGVQPAQPHELPRRRTATAAPARSARSRRPTIRASCSSGSSCCGSELSSEVDGGLRRKRFSPRRNGEQRRRTEKAAALNRGHLFSNGHVAG